MSDHSDRAVARLTRMSTDEKIGQLFVAPVGRHSPNALRLPPDQRTAGVGIDPLDEVLDSIRGHHLGGICFFPTKGEGDTPSEVAVVLAQLRAAVPDGGVPLIFSVDQEGGTVARLRRGFTGVPGAMALAATGDPASAEVAYAITGAELRAVGFHQDYAPSADVNVNPANPVIGVRSFGSDPASVSAYVAAAVKGLRDNGIAATVKHFPGHGDTAVDSHLDLPAITHSAQEWADIDAPPFAAAVEAGVDAVMSGHLAVPELDDSGAPATCSSRILDGRLRAELGFTGPVVTDALDMSGARALYGDTEVAVRALLGGADQLLMPIDLDGAIEAVKKAVADGRVSTDRLDEAVTRVLVMKDRLGLLAESDDDATDLSVVDSADHRKTALELTVRGLTVLGDRDLFATKLVAVEPSRLALTGFLGPIGAGLVEEFRLSDERVLDTGSDPDAERIAAAVALARDAEVTIVMTLGAWRWSGQQELLRALGEAGVTYAVVATKEPYDAAYAVNAAATLLSYGDGQAAVRGVREVATGRAAAQGRLPVDVPAAPDGTLAYRAGESG